ncbi:hypothetical protein D9758_006877 [Tetrapyrgos nigripes]|uniref:Helitron helicase-like domain-containing protein n=1 Tax=Tetrapyrgos nigripes TaxID=182062 RepID=A0A8H5GSZ4_9AGAR|nr:hypothetical protein D9758_006877 [Tetrapyrgos nigripes]
MQRRTFEAEAWIMSSISVKNLQAAGCQEVNHEAITDPGVWLLRKHVQTTMGHIMGSDASHTRCCSQIWSTSMFLGPPSLWITINPCDLHDPITQVFAGENIDMDAFIATMGPDADTHTGCKPS